MLLGVAGAPGTSIPGSHSRGEVAGPPAPPGPDPGRKGGLAESAGPLTLTWTPGRPTPRRFCPDPEAMVSPRLCWREGFYHHRSQFLGNIVICTLISEAGSADTRAVWVKPSPQSRRP